jgi:AraC-like DNA-binding protein
MDVLKKGMPKELTIESICTDAGFSSRTTFFIAFKKHTGMTPTQYLKKLEDG